MFIDWLPEMLHSWRSSADSKRKRARGKDGNEYVVAERLEDRTLLTFSWEAAGPSPIIGGQVEGMTTQNNPVVGTIQTVVAHPTNPDILYIGSANGGVWKTVNARNAAPTWTAVTDTQESMSIGAMDLDPTDSTGNTIVAGFGRYSSTTIGGSRAGLIRSIDGGVTWVALGDGSLIDGGNVSGVAARGQTLLVATDDADPPAGSVAGTPPASTSLGLFRSTNGGTSFTQVTAASGLPNGRVRDLVGVPTSNTTFYLSLTNAGASSGIYKSTDSGATWSIVSSPAMNTLMQTSVKVEIAAGRTDNVYVGILSAQGALAGVFRSGDAGATWTALDLPVTTDNGIVNGLNPVDPAGQHLSIAADPQNVNIVYVGGDQQPGPFPNSLGATNSTGRLFRIDASLATGSQVTSLTNNASTSRNSSPHADSREMIFDAAGNLIETDGGGIYRRNNPRVTGDWSSVNGNLQIAEIHSIAYDSVGNVLVGGTINTGTIEQNADGSLVWRTVSQSNGGVVAVDDQTYAAQGQSIRYSSVQGLGNFVRRTVDANNTVINTVPIQLRVGNQSLAGVDRNIPQYPVFELNAVVPTNGVLGTQTLYESFNQYDNLVNISGPTGSNIVAMAYGGWSQGVPNPDVLYYASGNSIFLRENAGDTPIQLNNYPGGIVQDIVLDPADYNHAFVIDTANVYVTSDAGETWQTITGNVGLLTTGQLYSIEYVDLPGTTTDALVIGATGGVFSDSLSSPSVWTRFGSGLPNVIAYDIEYDATDDVLTVGTLGHGAFVMQDASYTFNPPSRTGSVDFNKSVYQIGELVDITVRDIDLLNTGVLQVDVVSSSGDQETVQLTEIAGTGVFRGQIASSTSDNGFFIRNGTLEVDRGSTINVTYQDASNLLNQPQVATDSAQMYTTSVLYDFDFTDAAGQPTTGGFTTSGTNNQWHLSVGHGLDTGHTQRDSFYFGAGESLSSTGSYANNANGTLLSPQLSLIGATSPVFLEFNHLLEAEDLLDTATVRVILADGTSTIVASNNGVGNLPDSTLGAWVHQRIDLSGFVGQQIRIAFDFTSNASNVREGWYVDDVQLTGPAGEVRGTKFQDTNGNGVRDNGEPGLPGWVIFADANSDGVPDNSRTTFDSTPGVVPIMDKGLTDSKITVANVNGPLNDVDVRVTILHVRDSELTLTLISPAGTRVPLVSNIGGNGSNFSGTQFNDQAATGIQFGVAPYAGEFRPQSPLSALNGEPANGDWHLEIIDNSTGNVGQLVNWSITTSVADPVAITDANGDYALTGLSAGTYTIAEVIQNGWEQTFPHNNPAAPFTYTVTLRTGELVSGRDFGNQFVFPIVTTPSGDLTYTENDPPVIIDGRAALTDVNTDTNTPQLPAFANGSMIISITQNATADDRLVIRNQGTGTGLVGVAGNNITYGGLVIGTFSGGDGFNPLNIRFNPQATQQAAQAVLRSIQFYVVGDDPSPLTRTVEFVVTDNTQGISTPVTKLINVIPVNDIPIVNLTQTPAVFPENSQPMPIDLLATVTDPDSPDFNGGFLRVSLDGNSQGPVSGSRHVFSSVDTPYTLNNGVITSRITALGLNGTLTDVNVRVDITHTNDPDLVAFLISPAGTRVKLFSNVGTNTFSIRAQNFTNTVFDDSATVPILSRFATAPYTGSFLPEKELFTVNGEDPNGFWSLEITDLQGAIGLDGTGVLNNWSIDLGITEVSTNERLTILNQGSQTGEIGLVGDRVTYGGSVIGTFKGGVGTTPLLINFNSNATQDAVQALMANVAVQIQGENPIGGSRQAVFTINDGDGGTSNPVFRTIVVSAVNDAPVLELPAGQSTYIEGSAPTVLDVFATVTDIDSPNFDGGLLTVTLGSTAGPTDKLGIRTTGQNAGQINVVGTSVRYGTTTIGTLSGGTSSTPLTINFNSSATPEAIQALLRSITFQAVGGSPGTTPRLAQFQITDGDGGSSSVVSKTITVSQLNDAPVLTLSTEIIPPDTTPVSQVIYNSNGVPVILDSGVTITDSDNSVFGGGRLTVTLSSGSTSRDRLSLVSQGSLIVAGTNIFFANVLVGRLTPGVGSLPLTVDFNPSASREAVQAVARAITFQILGPSAVGGDRVATFQFTDGSGGTSQAQDRRIIVQTTNQAPVNTVPTVDYSTREDVSVALTGLGVSDSDASFQPIKVTLAVQHGTLTVLTNVAGGLTASEVTGNGTRQVVLTGDQLSINTTLQALNGVKYTGVLDYSGQDTLTMTTSDLGNSGPGGALTDVDAVFIDIQAVHDNARITPTTTTAVNVRGAEALLDPGITAQLGDGQTSLKNAVLTVNVTSGRNRSDRLRLLREGSGSSQLDVIAGKKGKPSNVKIGSLVIGTVTGGENGTPLKIVFNANATAADLQRVLRRITFRTAVQTTVFGERTLTFNFTDALGLPAPAATKLVNVSRY